MDSRVVRADPQRLPEVRFRLFALSLTLEVDPCYEPDARILCEPLKRPQGKWSRFVRLSGPVVQAGETRLRLGVSNRIDASVHKPFDLVKSASC